MSDLKIRLVLSWCAAISMICMLGVFLIVFVSRNVCDETRMIWEAVFLTQTDVHVFIAVAAVLLISSVCLIRTLSRPYR